jgi:hypothetical protein
MVLFAFLVALQRGHAQPTGGEVRIEVRDPQGAALPAIAELISDGNQFRQSFQLAQDGRYIAQGLLLGITGLL